MEKKVLRWNEYSFCPYMGPNSRENNGPNNQPAPCMIPSECSGISTFTTFTIRGLYILFPTFHLRRTRYTIIHSTTTFHNPPFLLLSLILNSANTVLRFQQHAIHMRNNDSVICLSYRLWNTTKHLSVNIKSCHAVIDIRFNPSRANSSDNYNFVSFPLKSRKGVLVALQNAYYFRQ